MLPRPASAGDIDSAVGVPIGFLCVPLRNCILHALRKFFWTPWCWLTWYDLMVWSSFHAPGKNIPEPPVSQRSAFCSSVWHFRPHNLCWRWCSCAGKRRGWSCSFMHSECPYCLYPWGQNQQYRSSFWATRCRSFRLSYSILYFGTQSMHGEPRLLESSCELIRNDIIKTQDHVYFLPVVVDIVENMAWLMTVLVPALCHEVSVSGSSLVHVKLSGWMFMWIPGGCHASASRG